MRSIDIYYHTTLDVAVLLYCIFKIKKSLYTLIT